MEANEPNRVKRPVEQRRIEGPIPEYDKYDRYTGYDYFRCRVCGAESMRRIDLEDCCDGA